MRLITPMSGRDPGQNHRPSTPLELFVDLTFVVAVAAAATELHHALNEDRVGHAVGSFLAVFFAIWWAWMGFTWFASAYDTDDIAYRLLVFVQMVGVLVLAAGVARAFENEDFAVVTTGYVIMRLALVSQWLRAARFDLARRITARRYAAGISVVQVAWVARLALPDSLFWVGFLVLAAAEIAVPIWAESAGQTPWHPGHMAERFGLFTLIVIGESVVAGTFGVQSAIDGDSTIGELGPIIVGALLILFSLWWVYFDMPTDSTAEQIRRHSDQENRLVSAFAWGYGHLPVLAGAAAVGAGMSVAIDHANSHSELSTGAASATVTVPVALFVLSVWVIHFPHLPHNPITRYVAPLASTAVLAATFAPVPVLTTGIIMTLLTATLVLASSRGAEAGHRTPATT